MPRFSQILGVLAQFLTPEKGQKTCSLAKDHGYKPCVMRCLRQLQGPGIENCINHKGVIFITEQTVDQFLVRRSKFYKRMFKLYKLLLLILLLMVPTTLAILYIPLLILKFFALGFLVLGTVIGGINLYIFLESKSKG